MTRPRSDKEREANRLRMRARYRALMNDPDFRAEQRANAARQNERRRADAEFREREREATRKRMADLRKDPEYRAKSNAATADWHRRKRLDAELEHFLQQTEVTTNGDSASPRQQP